MRSRPMLWVTTALVALVTATACGATAEKSDTSNADSGKLTTGLRLMVPNTAGGGYDTTARTAAKVMDDAKIATGVQVFNLPGAAWARSACSGS